MLLHSLCFLQGCWFAFQCVRWRVERSNIHNFLDSMAKFLLAKDMAHVVWVPTHSVLLAVSWVTRESNSESWKMGAGILKVQGFLKILLPLKGSITRPIPEEWLQEWWISGKSLKEETGFCYFPGCEQRACGVRNLEMGSPSSWTWLHP